MNVYKVDMSETMRGFKFLNPYGATMYAHEDFVYPLPRGEEKWGPWMKHPRPAVHVDGYDCGHGRWHVMKFLDARFAPDVWHPWFAEGRGIVGHGPEKFGCVEIRLRRIGYKTFWKILRSGYCANRDLSLASLQGARLQHADLSRCYLYRADFYSALMFSVNLSNASLRSASLQSVDLSNANLHGADLSKADLSRATLRGADLRHADFSDANLNGAVLDGARMERACFYRTSMREVDFGDADLSDVNFDGAVIERSVHKGMTYVGIK